DGDVAGAALAEDVVDRSLGDGHLEPIGVPHYPRRHVAAVGAAHYSETIGIHEVEPLEGLVEDCHHVLVVDRPPAGAALHRSLDGSAPCLAVASSASRGGV